MTGGGQLYTWGNNFTGQLGHGNFVNRLEPTLVKKGMFGVPQSFTVVMAACGHAHTLVVTHDGGLWACGRGDYGQLGLNDRVDKVAFRLVETPRVRLLVAQGSWQPRPATAARQR